MMINVVVSLYTSRLILEALGIVDFGLYNVVGGIIGLITFFQSTLTNVNMRFFSVGIGRNDEHYLRNIYTFSNYLFIMILVAVVVLSESFGVWMVNSWINIPCNRILAANVIFQCSVFSFAISLFSITSNAAVIAHEDMKAFAFVGLFQSFARLGVAFLLLKIYTDRLILYGFAELLIQACAFIYLSLFSKKHYKEFSISIRKNKVLKKEFFPFISWNVFGCFVWALNSQGINLLLNKFFDAAVNAARGFAFQINNLSNMFSSNLFAAFRPQIIKTYSNHEWSAYQKLVCKSSNYSFSLTWLLAIPIIININYLLSLWLKNVPQYTSIFSVLTLIFGLINVFNEPIWAGVQASGLLKRYQLYGNLIFLVAFPLSYVCLRLGADAYFPMLVLVVVRVIYIISVVYIVRQELCINFIDYLRKVIFPCVVMLTISMIVIIPFVFVSDSLLKLICSTIVSSIANLVLFYLIMLDTDEKRNVSDFIKNKF